MRGLVGGDAGERERLRTPVAWPSHLYAEVGNGLLRLHRRGDVSLARAHEALDALYAVDAEIHPVERLTRAAWGVALQRRLTAYDACYVVLAEGLGVHLVTADRRLAEATPNGVLVG
jgi:predicted nucleic acid-binding protein